MVEVHRGQRRLALTMVGAILLTVSVSACGEKRSGTASGQPQTTVSADPDLAARVPAAIKADGKIVVGTESSYAPAEFLDNDGKTVVGFDVDLFNAVAAKMGLKVEWVSANFGDIITGVNAGKYEAGVSSFTINDERKKQALMVSYYEVGTQWATRKGNPQSIAINNACGRKVAVQKDTVQVDDLAARSKKCVTEGRKPITVDQFPGQDAATAAVVSGKDDAVLADYPVMAYAVQRSSGQLVMLDAMYDAAPYGYVIARDQTAFAEVVRDATKAVMEEGAYRKVLQTWSVTDGAITDPTVNP
jgi:polar amino acid transport system substrate-binding protein